MPFPRVIPSCPVQDGRDISPHAAAASDRRRRSQARFGIRFRHASLLPVSPFVAKSCCAFAPSPLGDCIPRTAHYLSARTHRDCWEKPPMALPAPLPVSLEDKYMLERG